MSDEPRPVLSIDQQLALKTAAANLRDEFAGIFGEETIERFLNSSYHQFADQATIKAYLPLLAERFARQRLHALARVEGKAIDGKPVVLFLCVHNAGRSQMAMGFFREMAGDRAIAWSGEASRGQRSTLRRSRPCASSASTSAWNTRSPGPKRSFGRQTSW